MGWHSLACHRDLILWSVIAFQQAFKLQSTYSHFSNLATPALTYCRWTSVHTNTLYTWTHSWCPISNSYLLCAIVSMVTCFHWIVPLNSPVCPCSSSFPTNFECVIYISQLIIEPYHCIICYILHLWFFNCFAINHFKLGMMFYEPFNSVWTYSLIYNVLNSNIFNTEKSILY